MPKRAAPKSSPSMPKKSKILQSGKRNTTSSHRKNELKAQGIEKVVNKTVKVVEEHYDDCGEDLTGIGGLTEDNYITANYYDCWSDASSDNDEFEECREF